MAHTTKQNFLARRLSRWTDRHVRWFLTGVMLAGIGLGYLVSEIATFVPEVVRVDLDDLLGLDLVGLGALLAGLAAMIRATRNGGVEQEHHDELVQRVSVIEGLLKNSSTE